jgi:hypothetical protein
VRAAFGARAVDAGARSSGRTTSEHMGPRHDVSIDRYDETLLDSHSD